MPKPMTATVIDAGTIEVPKQLTKRFPIGSQFAVHCNNGTIVMEQVAAPDPLGRDPKALQRFDESFARLRKWADEKNITVADMKRALREVRQDKRAKSKGRSR